MKVLILDTAEAAEIRAAELIAAQLRAKPSSVLGLATGATMLPIYAALRRMHLAEGLSFAKP